MKLNYCAVSISIALFALFAGLAQGQQQLPTSIQSLGKHFDSINKKLLDMAQDFPADKYDFKPTKEVRSFGDVLVHIVSGNLYAAKAGRGEQVNWDELNPKDFKNKDEIVAALRKSIAEADATLRNAKEEPSAKTLRPWIDVIEHAAEHYGQLVVYYRINGLTPPESRPQTSTSDTEEQVKAAMRRYEQLTLAMNAERIAAMFTQDGELIDAGKTIARTPASIRAFLQSFDGKVRVEENVNSIESVTVTGETAILTGTYQQKALLLSDKREVRVQGKFEAEWSRQPDGQWLIRRMGTQSAPPR